MFDEVALREQLNAHLLNKIDQDVCKQNTNMSNLENMSMSYSPDLGKERNNMRLKIDSEILELEKEKRKEYLECWRDLMFLKKYLFSALKDYWDLRNRRDVLSGEVN